MDDDNRKIINLSHAHPGALAEWMAKNRDSDEPEYDETHPIEYLRKFCDWKQYLEELLDEDQDIIQNTHNIKTQNKDNEAQPEVKLDALQGLSPLFALRLLIIDTEMQQKEEELDLKSQKDKLMTLIHDGVFGLKNTFRRNGIYYYDPNEAMFSNAINLSLKLYHKVLFKLNIKNTVNNVTFNKSYSVIDLVQKCQHQNEYEKLSKIFNNEHYPLIPAVVSVIAQYSFVIYAKCINKSSVHFCYNAVMLNKDIYERLWFIKNKTQKKKNEDQRKEWKIGSKVEVYSCTGDIWTQGKVINAKIGYIHSAKVKDGDWLGIEYYVNDDKRLKLVKRNDPDDIRPMQSNASVYNTMYFQNTEEIAELIHIFQPRHCDPRYISERKVGKMDYLLYYQSMDTYCIVSSSGVELIDLELPNYLKPIIVLKEK